MATIKGIQRGTVTIGSGASSATVTITAVDVSKTELRNVGGSQSDSTGTISIFPRITLTNSTTITANSTFTVSAGTLIISWELTEFN